MADNISLLQYLQLGPPALPVSDYRHPEDNTSTSYSGADIEHIGRWTDFDLGTIMEQYRPLLMQTQIQHEPMPGSPPMPINSQISVRRRFTLYLESRVRRALRQSFQQLAARNQLGRRHILSFAEGDQAGVIDDCVPDIAYFATDVPPLGRSNRAPGVIKPSYKWSTALRNSALGGDRDEFMQGLSELNFYMDQHNAHYGFLLTDRELVAIRKIGVGRIELSDSIPWTAQGNAAQPRLTVLLSLWYLGMLAADDQN